MTIHEDGMQHIADLLKAKDEQILSQSREIEELQKEVAELEDRSDLDAKQITDLKAEIETLKGNPCPNCRTRTTNTDYEGYCSQSCFDGKKNLLQRNL